LTLGAATATVPQVSAHGGRRPKACRAHRPGPRPTP
jgi:hypothetical protein